ncbi:GNAT family N-acetyltransferase [Sulfidibacter corallicola]|uniref:GNAT family N-acetyltransferase n=1 Tax=Sulfidibacter corallicola TaxID=2818388 RepID=A0A8A4TG52_SULCO|nr:GNAT family N-acetyltransferase [Sulfidibacter corallicola]QTD48507.1 GNAT family N-acetyltransferase [Sulfidibacter corallicola]
MVSYRFCRPDDLPLLVEAINHCCLVPEGKEPSLTLAELKSRIQDRNLWASSCMIAMEREVPIAVLVGAKRASRSLVMKVGVVPEHRGQGHGTHLVQSLTAKLAILGPPDLICELPVDRPRLAGFFARCGFRRTSELVDFERSAAAPQPEDQAAIQEAALGDLLPYADLWGHQPQAWDRDREALINRKESLRSLAVVSETRVEAFVVYQRTEDACHIHRFGWGEPDPGLRYLDRLIRSLAGRVAVPLQVARLDRGELPFEFLQVMGFRERARAWQFAIEAGATD